MESKAPENTRNELIKVKEETKISALLEATTNVSERLITWVKISYQKVKETLDSGSQISVKREEVTREVQYEGDEHIDSAFGEKEVAPSRIFEMNLDDGVHEYVPEPWAVSKKLASDLILSTTAYEALRENVQMYGHETPSDKDVQRCLRRGNGRFFFKYRSFGGIVVDRAGDENMTQRCRDRDKGRRDEVNPDN
ncbi:CCHC-type domain-containing protein [Nephila pilipes]|uniref:CCHC-type domain-containing protein n=1 Tax=Nephila pilipes TaxID=299642 RepID=A0A8X6NJQ8_NEPPI|nr:CCHC-type domain-containing protein [Nephila pilipes]